MIDGQRDGFISNLTGKTTELSFAYDINNSTTHLSVNTTLVI